MLTERALWILRLVVVVLSAVSALMSFSRGDTTGVVIFGLLSALFLYQLIRPLVGGKDDDRDDRTPSSS
ncbi:hypothetical protein [Actinomyces naeslundii]|uniref:hypothetical protein n=1 Tax=Actinomyces naeslundii TaxID=1655 RepID=UPI00094C86ED|nr:hypothetical protein [Actinomyces naeslundii]OLO91348.1 hypothetical protein BKH10_03385 [Actinomyces naeslundii]OMG19353.1 hypothetical protein BKH38_07385 [Actinomyces naeslundii]